MKAFLNFVLVLYILATGGYFLYKYLVSPDLTNKILVTKKTKQRVKTAPKELKRQLPKYLVAYYVDFDKSFRTKVSAVYFKKGDLALAFVNSEPTAILRFKDYKATNRVDNGQKEVYAVFSVVKLLKNDLIDGDYGVLLFDYNLENYTNVGELPVTDEDKKTVERLSDTIYYANIDKKTAFTTKLEYEILKVNVDKYGKPDLLALVNWYPKTLPKGVRYTSLFLLYRGKDKTTRYDIIPITKTRKSLYHLAELVDLDNDGVKELFVRKERETKTYFIIYKFNEDFSYKKVDELVF